MSRREPGFLTACLAARSDAREWQPEKPVSLKSFIVKPLKNQSLNKESGELALFNFCEYVAHDGTPFGRV